MQFYFVASVPDGVDDASHLHIVLMDFPLPEQQSSYERYVAIGEVQHLIETLFKEGAGQTNVRPEQRGSQNDHCETMRGRSAEP